MDAVQGGTRGAPADIATLTAAAVAAVEASAAAPLPQSAAIVSAPLAAATSLFLGAAPTNEVLGVVAGNGAPTAPVESPPAAAPSTFTAAAAAAGVVHNSVASNGGGVGPGTRTVSTPKRRRLLRLEGGDLIVIPTNIYKQAGGVKLDITLGGFRIDNEKCTLKNRAYNFGVLPGFSRENILALRAFRDTLLPIDRSTPTSIHTIIAAEAITRYDEEHQKPPELASLAEESSFYGVGGWIPDSRVIHMTFTGSNMDLKVKAGDLRALDRPLQCKLALEALKSDPKVQAGTLEPAPPDLEVYGTGGTDTVGPEPGATGFARAPEPFPPSSSGARYGGKSAAKRAGGGVPRLPAGGANTEFSFLFGGGGPGFGEVDYGNEDGGDDTDSDSSKRYRKKKKKKKKKTVTVMESPAAATAAGGEGNAAATTVEYDLPLHVQSVEGKQCRPSLRLKVPLSGFLVDGEEVAPSELVVANGLDVTKKNLLALRACRDAVLANFAGPDLVKRVVAGEVFRVWAKRRGESAWAKRRAEAAATASTTFPPGGPGWTESAAGLLPQAVVNADDSLLLGGGGALTGPVSLQQPANGPSGGGAAGMAEVAAAESAALLAATGEAEHGDGGGGGSGGGTATNGHLVVTPSTTRASTAASRVISTSGGGLAVRPPALAMEDVFTLSSPAIFPGGPRTEVQMTVAELRRARQTRSNELKRLISAMLQDPEVQAGELEVMQEMSSPAITAKNLSGAAAAAAAAEAAAVAMRANSHTIALLASGQEERERASKSSIANGGGGGGGGGTATTTDGRDVASKVAERWGATLLQRSKRARAAGGGGWVNPSQADPSGLGAASAAGGVSALPTTAAANSNQRKELWALAIRENELRRDMKKDEDGKDGDGQEYEDRQKELLQWMVDEEAGRHDALDGGAGPPPPSWVVEKEGIGAGGGGGEPAPLT